MRVYFTEEANKKIQQLTEGKGIDRPNYIEEIKTSVNYDRKSRRFYVEIDTILSFSTIPPDWTERATLTDFLFAPDEFLLPGIYYWEEGVLEIKTSCIEGILKPEFRLYQTIKASAPDIFTLKSFYSLVRQRKLLPKENWGKKSIKDTIKRILFQKIF